MKIKIQKPSTATKTTIEPGRHAAKITQVVNVGLQKAFDPSDPPEAKLGIAFELEGGTVVARTVTASGSQFSLLGQVVEAVGLDADELDLGNLLGRDLAIEIDQNDRGFIKITAFSPLEDFEDPIKGTAEALSFDVDDMPKDKAEANRVLRALHAEIRQAISRRVRGVAQ
jgi:hypothetical protein